MCWGRRGADNSNKRNEYPIILVVIPPFPNNRCNIHTPFSRLWNVFLRAFRGTPNIALPEVSILVTAKNHKVIPIGCMQNRISKDRATVIWTVLEY